MTDSKHYIWRCGNNIEKTAVLEAVPDEKMENLNPSEVKFMLDGVCRTLGFNDHTHIFRENNQAPEGVVIYDCPGKAVLHVGQ